MKRYFTKFLSVLMAVFILLSSFVVTTSAAEAVSEDILTSDVTTDLQKMGIDITKYQKDSEAEHVRLLHFLEFGYDYNGDQSEYGLFLYVWNPTGKALKLQSPLNRVTIQARSVTNIEQSNWRKVPFEILDVSDEAGYENVFYKIRIHPGIYDSILSRVSKSIRVYEISEIELHYDEATNAKSFTVGGTFTCTGWQPYHNSLRNAVNSLSCNSTDRTVIEIEINPTTWKTETSSKGVGYANELFSVYFAIPNDIIRDYGNTADKITKGLVQIDGTYDKHKINGLVVNDDSAYSTIKANLGITVPNSTVPFQFYTDTYTVGETVPHMYYENPYNIVFDSFEHVSNTGDRAYREINVLTSVLKAEISDKKDFISALTLRSSLYSLWNDFGKRMYIDPPSEFVGPVLPGTSFPVYGDNLNYSVSSKDENGNYVDLADQIKVYSSNHNPNLWDVLFGNALFSESSYENIKSIQVVDSSVVLRSNDYISNYFYVSERDVDSLRSFVNNQSLKNKTTYLMRFAVEDYYAAEATISKTSANGVAGNAIYFEKTIFTNVDILTFTFENKMGGRVILPVAATPQDNVGEITPTVKPDGSYISNEDTEDENQKNWEIFRLLLMFSALILFFAFVTFVFNAFGYSWSKLFKGLSKILNKIFGFLKRIFTKITKAIKKLFK